MPSIFQACDEFNQYITHPKTTMGLWLSSGPQRPLHNGLIYTWENTFMTCKEINFPHKKTYTGDSPLAAVGQLS